MKLQLQVCFRKPCRVLIRYSEQTDPPIKAVSLETEMVERSTMQHVLRAHEACSRVCHKLFNVDSAAVL